MKNLFFIFITLCVPIFFVLVFIMGTYNKLVTLRNRIKNAGAQIDGQRQRRHDLILNLIETAQDYLGQERSTLEAVITARNAASAAAAASDRAAASPGDPAAMKELTATESALNESLARLFALSEATPALNANTTLNGLREELSSVETKASVARQACNDSVMTYNTARKSFPASIIASLFHFAPAAPFQIENKVKKEALEVSS